MVDSKEDDKFDLGVKGLRLIVKFGSNFVEEPVPKVFFVCFNFFMLFVLLFGEGFPKLNTFALSVSP